MKEYGGYLELERNRGKEYHSGNVLALNNARSALVWLLRERGIKKIFLPHFICDTVIEACETQCDEVKFYNISQNAMPELPKKDVGENGWVYVVNYFGALRHIDLELLKNRYGRIILDNVQAFFSKAPEGIDTIYSCRKFFGVPDGAYLVTDLRGEEKLDRDISGERMNHLVGRLEENANAFYRVYQSNEIRQECIPKRMSLLTHNLLRGIDYQFVKHQREENYRFLEKNLGAGNEWPMHKWIPEGAFAYPLCISNAATLRKRLQEKLVYVPLLWPNVLHTCNAGTWEYKYSQNVLVLPVDQRYTVDDMKDMLRIITEAMKG